MSEYQYKRVLLKISGEALMGNAEYGIDPDVVERMAIQVKQLHDEGIEVAVVVGGGNIFRGVAGSAKGMERAQADLFEAQKRIRNLEQQLRELQQVREVVVVVPTNS